MSETSGRGASFRVEFDLPALAEDSDHSTAKGRAVMDDAVRNFEERGIAVGDLRACEAPGHDGTWLPGCVKTYLPPPVGNWGMIFELRIDRDQSAAARRLPGNSRSPAAIRRR